MSAASITFNLLPGGGKCYIPLPLSMPGVVIFVHGVNSDGEWYEASEDGLCAGLNRRLARQTPQMAYPTPEGGQMTPLRYMPELTADGFLRRDRNAKTFLLPDPACSNVIRFRWGYKAGKEELKEYGDKVWLNENDYWGGGPFANGCSTVADLWGEGLNDQLFLWITAQHLNPAVGRDVYACPPRAYYVHAALRLAKLIESIRSKQTDCPITVVCHSQGNMVGLGAAFLADRLGVQADNYVLCNPPLSLMAGNFTENWSQRHVGGRQNLEARTQTLANFFALLRARAGQEHSEARVDRAMANKSPCDGSKGYTAGEDRKAHGLRGSTYGRVTLYCNPHDQVISALPVQGIGWRGMNAKEIEDTSGDGVFTQRVFAQGYDVGQAPGASYDYWMNRWNKDAGPGQDGFWHPPSPEVRFSLRQGLEASDSVAGKVITVLTAPVLYLVRIAGMTVNGEPDKADKPEGSWRIPINAPALPEPIRPMSLRYGRATVNFDEGYDPAGNARNAGKAPEAKNPDDLYDKHPTQATRDHAGDDAPMGDEGTEARLRYEDRARLRMKARRAGRADESGQVIGEDEPDQASPDYARWRNQQVADFLKEGVDQAATDHSTIVTNPMHAQKVMAYDVAIGVCSLTKDDWEDLRVEADWRYVQSLKRKGHPHSYLGEYFNTGLMGEIPLERWAKEGEASMPEKVIDKRTKDRGAGRPATEPGSQAPQEGL